MLEIKMSRDIREFSPKVLGPFDKRQIVVLAISIFTGVPIFLLLGALPLQFKLIVSLIVVLPILLCGWVKMFGMPLEVFVFKFIIPTIFNPRKKVYITENFYENLFTEKGQPSPYKAEPLLRNVEVKKLSRKEKKAKKALLDKYEGTK